MFSLLISKKKSEEFIVSDVCLHIPVHIVINKANASSKFLWIKNIQCTFLF